MNSNSIIIQQTTQAQLKDLISDSVKEALESLRADLKTTPASTKITRQQLKDEFHLSFPTILKLEKKGILQGYRIGRRVLFDRKQVEAALQERRFK